MYEARYFKGYIHHESIDVPFKVVFLYFSPLLVNTFLCVMFFFPVALEFLLDNDWTWENSNIQFLLTWMGISVGVHALPYRLEIEECLGDIPMEYRNDWWYWFLDFVSIIFIAIDFLRKFGVDFFYAVGSGMAIPYLITKAFITF
ncbi:MAG: hypothetical protein KC643_13370 [Nitrospira sp.]|nr:hypothetical protein [Nitrospira sp.]